MSQDIDRIVEMVAERIKARLAGAQQNDNCTGEDCTDCGQCTTKRPEAVLHLVSRGADRISSTLGVGRMRQDLACLIDHTLLHADASHADLDKLCQEAAQYSFASVCVNSANVAYTARRLAGTSVMTVAVVGFPLGASTPAAKAFEAREAIRAGAEEIDMVMNVGAMRSKEYGLVYDDIRKVVEASKPKKVKVILETASLTHDEKVIGCALAKVAQAAFVKTSTGFGKGGATAEDVSLMRAIVGEEMGVKASGGIRTTDDADRMVLAGATRIGASASVSIVTGKKSATKGY